MKTVTVIFILIFVFCVLSVYTADIPEAESTDLPPRYIVRMDRLEVTDMQLFDTLSISVESFGNLIAGFDLKFGTNSSFIDILEVLPGEVNDSCNWEYFGAKVVNNSNEAYPCQLWQAVAIAKMTPDSTLPTCFGFERTASLLKIVVASETRGYIPDTLAPIFFFWEDCSDNSLSDETGTAMIISRQVYDYLGTEISDAGQIFPTHRGSPRQCIKPEVRNKPVRQIDFHNGGVTFKQNQFQIPPQADTTEPEKPSPGQ